MFRVRNKKPFLLHSVELQKCIESQVTTLKHCLRICYSYISILLSFTPFYASCIELELFILRVYTESQIPNEWLHFEYRAEYDSNEGKNE